MRISKKRKAEIRIIIKLWRIHFSLAKVARILELPYKYILNLLETEANTNNLSDLRKIYRIRRPLSMNMSNKLLKIKSLYDQFHTLQKVADILGVTRERIRQLLSKGEEYGLYEYEVHRDAKFKELIGRHGRDSIIEEIKHHISRGKICASLNIPIVYFIKLLKYYNIDSKYYYDLARKSKCLNEYSKIVDHLGYHPTTTEMISRPSWRAIWARIDRYWGNIDKFRKEYGIEKPIHRIHVNTLACFQNNLNKRIKNKKTKVDMLINLINDLGPIGASKICEITGLSRSLVNIYLKQLFLNKAIIKQGVGMNTKYLISNIASKKAFPYD